MTTEQLLRKFIKFYEDRGHKLVPNMSLVPDGDSTLLFVNSGMFPLVPYLSGQPHPLGKRLVNVQRSLRLDDIENAGNTIRHTFAFHMIGNWSLGDYFKDEQLPWVYEFLIEELKLDPNRLFATVFRGDANAPKDDQSIEILKNIFNKYGIVAKEGERIFAQGIEDNWWKRGDAVGELGGPDSEVFYYLGSGDGLGKNPAEYDTEFLEIGNSVFMQYFKTVDGWADLPQKNVDFGGGLERIAMVVQGKNDIFETDTFWPIIQKIQNITGKDYKSDSETTKAMRILADHIRGSVFLAMDGVIPGNKDQGYVLRRILRRMVRNGRKLGINKNISVNLVGTVVDTCSWLYPELVSKRGLIENIFQEEEEKFSRTLDKGSVLVGKWLSENKDPSMEDLVGKGFDFYQSVGYPIEIFVQDLQDFGYKLDFPTYEKMFQCRYQEHQVNSRSGAEQKFKGGLADASEETVKYHTTTHILHWALRELLGNGVHQHGSNITAERLRFDFNHAEKLSQDQLKGIEDLINTKVGADIPVHRVEMPKDEAEKSGALHFFNAKYGDTVSVYYLGENLSASFSKEFCGGPHVTNLVEIPKVSIYKIESIGKGIQRIYLRFV